MKIAPTPIRSKITRFLEIRRYEREQKFLDRFCTISDDIDGDTFTQLNSARKTIANYAKSKGVTVEFSDAEKKVAREQFEFDIDEIQAARAAKNKLSVTVRPLKKLPQQKGGRLLSMSEYVSKDTSETHLHIVDDYFVVEIPSEGLQQTRLTKHEYEDSFLRHIYRVIEKQVKAIYKK